MKVIIVGAGPSGLVTCKSLQENATPDFPFDPMILEQEDNIGGTFRYRSYENASLVSSKQLTSFSDFRLPLSDPDHLSLEEYVAYLYAYAVKFAILPKITFNSKVVNIQRHPSGGHIISYVQKNSISQDWESEPTFIHADYVALCTGLHVIPSIPTIPGIEDVLPRNKIANLQVFHSSNYKSRDQLANKRVMVLGTGETGLDIAYEAVKAGSTEVVLCCRSGFLSFPKALNDFEVLGFRFESKTPVPIDTLITNLGETAYVHPWVTASHIRWFVSDFILKRLLWVLTGTQAGCNQWVGELESGRLGRAYVFLNKSHRAMPYINRPYRNRSKWLDYISKYSDPPEDTPPQTNFVVDFAPFPTHFLSDGTAVFPTSRRKDAIRISKRAVIPQVLIYATGYTQNFDYLDGESDYATPDTADMRNVTKTGDESVAFIGFLRPGVGAIPPLAEMQVLFWISVIKQQLKRPLKDAHYHLLVKETARIQYGVDHSTYMSTLAKDIGAAPGLWELWQGYGFHVLICYCFGAAFSPFYRLVGPFRSPVASQIVKTEIWETITRRGILGNLIMGLLPMIFYLIINAIVYVVASALELFHEISRSSKFPEHF